MGCLPPRTRRSMVGAREIEAWSGPRSGKKSFSQLISQLKEVYSRTAGQDAARTSEPAGLGRPGLICGTAFDFCFFLSRTWSAVKPLNL